MKWAAIREFAAWSLVVLLALRLLSKGQLLAQIDVTASQETRHDDGDAFGSEIMYSQLGATDSTVLYGKPPPGPAKSSPPIGEPGARSPRLSYRRGAGAFSPLFPMYSASAASHPGHTWM